MGERLDQPVLEGQSGVRYTQQYALGWKQSQSTSPKKHTTTFRNCPSKPCLLLFPLSQKKIVFTGLIQGLGTLRPLGGDRFSLSVQGQAAQAVLSDLARGDSVAVDGVCLTVEEILLDGFVATASPETLQRTTLGRRALGADRVNLETSLRVGSKLGGHFVSGHVDGIGALVESVVADQSWEMAFAAPPTLSEPWQRSIAPYLASKGSIAVNGISLTLADCDPQGNWFKVAVIPHTYAETNLCRLKLGDWVNLETDILGKYVAKLLGHSWPAAPSQGDISLAFLAEHGYWP